MKTRLHPELAPQMRIALDLAFRLPVALRDVDYREMVNLARKSDLTTYDASHLWLANHLGAELVTFDARLDEIAEGKKARKRPK